MRISLIPLIQLHIRKFCGGLCTFMRFYPMFNAHRQRILAFARMHQLPTVCGARPYAEAGCLMAYAPDIREMWRRAAVFVDKILKGAKPGDLPVEQPVKFELVLNLKTAQALGITMPPSLLILADEVMK